MKNILEFSMQHLDLRRNKNQSSGNYYTKEAKQTSYLAKYYFKNIIPKQ